jgi:hypothetical protein
LAKEKISAVNEAKCNLAQGEKLQRTTFVIWILKVWPSQLVIKCLTQGNLMSQQEKKCRDGAYLHFNGLLATGI